MRRNLQDVYVCPASKSPLDLEAAQVDGDDVVRGRLVAAEGREYPIEGGIPDFTFREALPELEARTREEYDLSADEIYDKAVDWQFAAMYENEDEVREEMLGWLDLEPQFRVLEIGAGTGRDSFRIARRLESEGEFFMQDLSPNMVTKCRENMARHTDELGLSCEQHFFISNATYLPLPDDYFDAVFHFGGFNQFSEKKKSLEEISRVAKMGSKIVFGDESVAPWLRGTEFEGIVTTNNPLFDHDVPMDTLPIGARDVCLHWILRNCFYVFEFRKGEGPPRLDLDLPHAGRRGGTMRTRYYGRLEGVTLETKKLAVEAAAKRGMSLHEWLDRIVRGHAEEDLAGDDAR